MSLAEYSSAVKPIDRIVSQYNNSSKFRRWVDQYNVLGTYACSLSCEFAQFFDIDKASGEWLNVIGRIVGQPRSVVDTTKLDIFGFDGDVDSYGFNVGVFTDGSYGAVAIDASDNIYRRMVRAKVLKNASNCSRDDLLRSIEILSNRSDFILVDFDDPMQFGIEFGGDGVDAISKVLIEDYDLMPVALGVALTTVT